jgi:hypothetical protein
MSLHARSHAWAQSDAPATQSVQRGENFSAKPAPALFASDCTGASCHKGPQGLGKRFGLAAFLREHYTNSRESAQALANYLAGIQAPADRSTRQGRETPGGRTSRAAVGPDDDTPNSPAAAGHRSRRSAEPADTPEATPAAPGARGRRTAEPSDRHSRGQRGRQATAAPPSPPLPSPEPSPEPAADQPAPPASQPQVFDIFD